MCPFEYRPKLDTQWTLGYSRCHGNASMALGDTSLVIQRRPIHSQANTTVSPAEADEVYEDEEFWSEVEALAASVDGK